LTLVRSLVELHGGTVEAHCAGPGQGSEFLVRLPLSPHDLPPEPQTLNTVSQSAPSRRRRVLVVDDNSDLAQSQARLLQLLGHEVRVANDGPSAVVAAEAFVPDLALVDIGLPGINGYDVARRIREHPDLRHVVLVAQTGWGREEDRRRSREAGFDHHVVKPLELGVLKGLLAAIPGEE
jgi:two-component system CheB/CheR fusion protein